MNIHPNVHRFLAEQIKEADRLRDCLREAKYLLEVSAYRNDPRFVGQAWDCLQRGLHN